ncbi:MAG: DUF3352 domain-containing protein, partial [Leptolyngbyaceae cyanobacterium SL_7_1]|nr:DUF3352 domain-containing protein [Leptolyngbyaceae cyanobacterium SL_7_1]
VWSYYCWWGAIGFGWLSTPSNGSGGRSGQAPTAAVFVSRQAPVMVSLLSNPDRLAALRLARVSPAKRQRARAELEQLKQTLLGELTYEQDVQPWIGNEITAAVTNVDVDRNGENGQQPGYLLAIATRDPQRSREFLQLFWQKRAIAGTDLVFEQYSGVQVIYGKERQRIVKPPTPSKTNSTKQAVDQPEPNSPDTPTLATAVVGDRFVLFANYPKVLRDAINNVQATELNLTSIDAYQQTVQRLSKESIGLVFSNLAPLGDWLGGDPSLPFDTLLYQHLGLAVEVDRQGLVAPALLTAPKNQILAATKLTDDPFQALQFIPASSSLVAVGDDLQSAWTKIQTGVAGDDRLVKLVEQPFLDLQQRWQIDVPKQVFPWVQSEYALGLVPDASPKPDWVFVARRSPAAAEAIAEFDAIAQKQGLSTGTLMLGDRPVSAWTKLSTTSSRSRRQTPTLSLQTDVQGVHTTVDDYEIFATSIEAISQALSPANQSLLAAEPFQQAIAPFHTPRNGYFYIDWATLNQVIKQQLPIARLLEAVGQPILSHIRSIAITNYGTEANGQYGAIGVQLQDP